jgi:hypothetical protein
MPVVLAPRTATELTEWTSAFNFAKGHRNDQMRALDEMDKSERDIKALPCTKK